MDPAKVSLISVPKQAEDPVPVVALIQMEPRDTMQHIGHFGVQGGVFHEEEHEILSVEQRREPTRRPLTVQGRDRLVRFRVKSPNLTL
jgi:hypothetical protein